MKNKIVYLVPILSFLIGMYLMPLSILETDLSKIPGDLGDSRFNNYVLEHGHKYFSGKTESFWNAPFLFPYKNVTALSDNLLGTLPIYSIFRIAGADRETAFQFWLLTLFALNFICCFYALNKWSKNVILASVGAYIFAFSIYNIGQLDHVQVFPKFIAPLVLYWLWKFISEVKLKYFVYAALGLVYQFYCGMYLAFMLFYILLFFLIAYVSVNRNRTYLNLYLNKKILIGMSSILLLSLVLLLPLIKPYLEVANDMGMRKFENAINTIPKPRSFFFTSDASLIWNFLSHHCVGRFPDWWAHRLFFGALPWIGVIAACYFILSKKVNRENKTQIYFLLLSVFLSVIFCLNLHGITLYKIIFMLPGFSSMRAIDRFINMEVILFIVLFVIVFNKLNESFPKMKYFIFSLPLLVIIDNSFDATKVKRFDKKISQQRIETVKSRILKMYNSKYSAIAYLPFLTYVDENTNAYLNTAAIQLDVMTATQELNIACVNSYTGFDPGNYIDFFFESNDKTLKNWCEFNHFDYEKIQRINDLGKNEKSSGNINLIAFNGKYLTGLQGDDNPMLYADRATPGLWEKFTMVHFENNDCLIKASTNLLWSLKVDQHGKILASNSDATESETFHLTAFTDSTFSIRAANGLYLSVDTSDFSVSAKSVTIGEKEVFKIVKL